MSAVSSATLALVLLGAACSLLGATLTVVVPRRLPTRRGPASDAAESLCLDCGHPRVAHGDTGCRHTTDGLRCACDTRLSFPHLTEPGTEPRHTPVYGFDYQRQSRYRCHTHIHHAPEQETDRD